MPADEAHIEFTFVGDGASFVGDREIVEGTVTALFSNESDGAARVAVLGYETGSDALAEELEIMEEAALSSRATRPPTDTSKSSSTAWVKRSRLGAIPGRWTWLLATPTCSMWVGRKRPVEDPLSDAVSGLFGRRLSRTRPLPSWWILLHQRQSATSPRAPGAGDRRGGSGDD